MANHPCVVQPPIISCSKELFQFIVNNSKSITHMRARTHSYKISYLCTYIYIYISYICTYWWQCIKLHNYLPFIMWVYVNSILELNAQVQNKWKTLTYLAYCGMGLVTLMTHTAKSYSIWKQCCCGLWWIFHGELQVRVLCLV
jgi:hypothetical protein